MSMLPGSPEVAQDKGDPDSSPCPQLPLPQWVEPTVEWGSTRCIDRSPCCIILILLCYLSVAVGQ